MKKIMIMFALLISALMVNAQKAIETSTFIDNVYVGIGGQVSTPTKLNKVFPLNSAVNVVLGKEFTPVFGANLEGDFWLGSHSTNGRFDKKHNVFRGSYVGLNSTVNLSNLFSTYKRVRPFEIQTIIGIGWAHTFNAHMSDRGFDDLGAKTGLNLNINFGDAHSICIQPAVLWNLTNPASHHDRVAFNKIGSQLSLGIGYVYHFKNSNKTHSFKVWDIDSLNNRINILQAKLDAVPKVIETEKVIEKVVENKKVIGLNNVIFFAQNSYELSNTAKEELNKIPEGTVIKTIAGYASMEGTPEYNLTLSENRANVVADYLKNRNVKVENVVGLGVQGETSNRVVIIVL